MDRSALAPGEGALRAYLVSLSWRSDELLLQKFYWNGIKLINVNRKHVRAIQARAKGGGKPLTRWETRFIANYHRDALK